MDWLEEIGKNLPESDYIESLNVVETSTEAEWQQQRLGKFTASRFGDLMKQGRKKDERFGKMALNYMYEKIAEIITGVPHFVDSRAIEWGNDHEDEAIDVFESKTGAEVQRMGTVFHQYPKLHYVGSSPDGFIGEDGIIEVKCPYVSANHIKTALTQELSDEYYFQVQGNLMVTGKHWCEFISYDPRCKGLELEHFTIERDEEVIEVIHERMKECKRQMKKLINQLKKKGIEL